ncbi:hypothetical protein [Ruania zhangjianzhongii]|nr:hypothetical protein [Ruania zhangjianzhongii]
MLPLRRRLVPVLSVFLVAPITAEYLSAYLSFTGDLWTSLATLLFFAPLYGGAALLIREASVRTGCGWAGTLVLAAAFGLAMPGVIDLALFGEDRADVAFWSELREPTLVPSLGFSVFPALSWTLGHVMMSIGAPLALLYALAPAHRGRPLLGKVGLPLTVAAAALVVVAVHQDGRQTYGYTPSVVQVVTVLAVVTVIAALTFTRLGGPVTSASTGRRVPAAAVVLGAMVLKGTTDLLPPTWAGTVSLAAIVAISGATLGWCVRQGRWGAREIGLLGAGVVLAGTLTGFATPVPDGVTHAAKFTHSGVLLTLAVVLLVVVHRRAEPGDGHGAPAPRAPGPGEQGQRARR